ncbi:ChaB family protein [Candidatus Nitrospira bockiana]
MSIPTAKSRESPVSPVANGRPGGVEEPRRWVRPRAVNAGAGGTAGVERAAAREPLFVETLTATSEVLMPRGKRERTEIPETIRRSDKHAQEIWTKTHDSAVETYGEGARAHRVAYASLKHSYKKEGDHWVKKAERGPSDPQAARGPTTRPSSTAKPAPTARGKIAKTEAEARVKAKEARKEAARATRARTSSARHRRPR